MNENGLEGIYELYRRRMIDGFLKKVKETSKSPYFVLVVDREALRYLTTVLSMKEISSYGVSMLEILDRRREPLPGLHAAYLLRSDLDCVSQFTREDAGQYASFHLFFLSPLSDGLLQKIKEKQPIMRKVKSLWELNLDFLAMETNGFSLNRPAGGIPNLYGSSSLYFEEEVEAVVQRLTNACELVAPASKWKVRYPVASKVGTTAATMLAAALGKRALSTEKSSADSTFDAATVLILDRMADPATPLVHDFTFHAMVNDLLDLDRSKPGGARYYGQNSDPAKSSQTDPVLEDEQFPIWKKYKHKHVAEVSTSLGSELKAFVDSNAAAKIHLQGTQNVKDVDVKDLSSAIRALPEYSEKLSRHAAMVNALNDSMMIYKKSELENLALTLVTGRTACGERSKSRKVLNSLAELLESRNIGVDRKSRLLTLAFAVAESTKSLYFSGGLPSYLSGVSFKYRLDLDECLLVGGVISPDLKAPVLGMQKIIEKQQRQGLDYKYAMRNSEYKRIKKDIHNLPKRTPERSFDVSRYRPQVYYHAANLVEDCLLDSLFPFVSVKGASHSRGKQLFMIFVVGGICHSEIKAISDLSAEIAGAGAAAIIGGSAILTSNQYLKAVAGVCSEAMRVKAVAPPPPLLVESMKPSDGTPAGEKVKEVNMSDLNGGVGLAKTNRTAKVASTASPEIKEVPMYKKGRRGRK